MTKTPLRRSGVLLHLTSLPGPHGSGDLGESARHFVDWLQAGAQTLWQILPLNGVGPGNSPYMSPSAFAGNELLIALAPLVEEGLLSEEDLAPRADFSETAINFSAVRSFRFARLYQAFEVFYRAQPEKNDAFVRFCEQQHDWLHDYALFMSLDTHFGAQKEGTLWQEWPTELARHEKKACREAEKQFAKSMAFWKFCQWQFQKQWLTLKAYANSKGVLIVGDIPIFVAPHSADVWAHQNLFDLDSKGHLKTVAGVPPDYFSATGQHWGNPLYHWAAHKEEHYAWWTRRLETLFALCDIARIDHFRGFDAFWEIPAGSENAILGAWKKGPGYDFFKHIFEHFQIPQNGRIGYSRIIAEDLGVLTPEVIALREKTGLPGMRILQFAFDGKSDNFYQPHNFDQNTVVYTGTHDNDTTVGWWQKAPEYEKDHVRRYFGISGENIAADLIRAGSASVAAWAIFPMQDVLGLGSDARMNAPSQATGAWEWRFRWSQVAAHHAEHLAYLTHLYGRAE